MKWTNSDIVYASCWVPRAGLELAQKSMIKKGLTTMKNKNGNTAKIEVLRSCLEKAGNMQSTLNIKNKNGGTRPNEEVQRNSFTDQMFINQHICMEAACQMGKFFASL